MLTSQLRGTIRPRSLSSPTLPTTHLHARTLFGWRRRSDWESQLDPLYTRINRCRALKTRKMLMQTLRRRSRFDWDVSAKPFLTPKHVRWASHWNGKTRWDESADPKKDGKEDGEEGYELSQREKAWKERMEMMRKRIDGDPYEAVFGKRFEPFWSPLVPSWMREEMGLPGSEGKKQQSHETVDVKAKEKDPEQTKVARKAAKEAEQVSNWYAQSSSTSWDSETNKTKTTQWDSVSNRTRSFEYDPVSGRMVPINLPDGKSKESRALTKAASRSLAPEKQNPEPTSIDKDVPVKVPVKTLKDRENMLSTPPQTQCSSTDKRPAAKDDRASQSTEQGLDSLTADDVRSSMGKSKKPACNSIEQPSPRHLERRLARAQQTLMERSHQNQGAEDISKDLKSFNSSLERLRNQIAGIADTAATKPFVEHLQTSLERSADAPKASNSTPLQPAVQRMQSKSQPEPNELDDSAAHESTEPVPTSTLPKSWDQQAELLQSERVKRTASKRPYPTTRWLDDMNARKAEYDAKKALEKNAMDAANFEKNAKLEKANAMLQAEVQSQKVAMREHGERYAHKIKDLRAELDVAYKQSSVHADEFKNRISKLTSEPTSEQSEKDKRYTQKIKSLRGELERAYKQSSVHADEFVKRIKALEAEISQLKKVAPNSASTPRPKETGLKAMQGEGDFCTNITQWADSEKWYKQPATTPRDAMQAVEQAEQQARDRELVRKVRGIYEKAYGLIDHQHTQPQYSKDEQLQKALGGFEKARSGCYAYKEDGLEAELCGAKEEPKKAAQKFKSDGLEAELQKLAEQKPTYASDEYVAPFDLIKKNLGGRLVKSPEAAGLSEPQKRTMSELEAELQRQAQEGPEYASDEYAAEVEGHGKAVPEIQAKPAKPFMLDGLEAELRQRSKQEPAYASDEYEASVAAQGKTQVPSKKQSWPEKAVSDLEAELVQRSKQEVEYASDQYQAEVEGHARYASQSSPKGRHAPSSAEAGIARLAYRTNQNAVKPQDLESELKARAQQEPEYASDQYQAAADRHNKSRNASRKNDLAWELRSRAEQQPEYASDQYEAEVESQKPAVALHKGGQQAELLKQQSSQEPQYGSDEYAAAAGKYSQSGADARFTPDGLAAELKQKTEQAPEYASDEYEAAATRAKTQLDNSVDMEVNRATTSVVQWQEPPLYKVLAYDSGNDRFSTATTTTYGSGLIEEPLSISKALSELYEPAKFVPQFAKLQDEGYQVVSTGKDVLVFRKVQGSEEAQTTQAVPSEPEPEVIDSQPADPPRNPVDGMAKHSIRPATGNFASPTGFVNYDDASTTPSKDQPAEDETLYRHYPRVNREEPVFSGTRRVYHQRRRHWAEKRKNEPESARREHRKSGWKWVLGTGAVIGGGMYLMGSIAEKQRERQVRMREGVAGLESIRGVGAQDGRWGLDEGRWRGGK